MAVLARVYLVRHGETDANRDGIIQGQMDTPLNERGVQQANIIGEALGSIPFDTAYSSDLIRASKTAELILKHHPHIRLEKQQELRERYMGNLQGQAVQLKKKWESIAVETTTSFVERNVSWWNKTILDGIATHPPNSPRPFHILVTTHGGVISTMLRTLVHDGQLECAPGVVIGLCANTSVTVIDVDDDRLGTVTKYGDVSHLRDDEDELETNADEVEVK